MDTQKLLAAASAFLFVVAGMTSCNKDNGGKDARPVIGKYEISDASSPIKSIELTSGGEYIVTKNPAKTKADGDLELDDVWAYGDFTVADGFCVLQGFGKVAINLLSGGTAELVIDRDGWDPFTVQAGLASTVQETELNRSLCRHWTFDKTHFALAYNDITLVNFELDGCDFSQWLEKTGDDEAGEVPEEKITGLIFTESGTYAVVYDGGKVNVGSWSWENAADGSLKCDWNTQYKSFFKDYRFQGGLSVNVTEGDPDTCTIVRSFESTMSKYHLFSGLSTHSLKTTLTYYLTEEK